MALIGLHLKSWMSVLFSKTFFIPCQTTDGERSSENMPYELRNMRQHLLSINCLNADSCYYA